MDRRQKIMRLIIDTLAEYETLRYECTGALTVLDPNLISLDFAVRNNVLRSSLTVRGLTDMPLALKAQYDPDSPLSEHPAIRQQIDKDLETVSAKINRLL